MRRLIIVPSEDSRFGDQTGLDPALRRSMLGETEFKRFRGYIDQLTEDAGDQPRDVVLNEEGPAGPRPKAVLDDFRVFLEALIEQRELDLDLGVTLEGRISLTPRSPRAVAAMNLLATIRAGTKVAMCPQCGSIFTPGKRADIAKFCCERCKTAHNNAVRLGKA